MNTPSSESTLTPTSGTLTMQPMTKKPTGLISYWQMKVCAEQPPDFVGTVDEIDEWVKRNPPVSGAGRLLVDGRDVLLVQQSALDTMSRAMADHFLRGSASEEASEPGPSLLDIVHESSPIDTSMPFYEFQKQAQRATTKMPAPSIPGSSRAQRRALGDRRTVKQIMAEQRREGR